MKQKKSRVVVTRTGRRLVLALLFVFSFAACNVTRKVTTESSYYKSGDTTTTIVTKTIESYDASKKL